MSKNCFKLLPKIHNFDNSDNFDRSRYISANAGSSAQNSTPNSDPKLLNRQETIYHLAPEYLAVESDPPNSSSDQNLSIKVEKLDLSFTEEKHSDCNNQDSSRSNGSGKTKKSGSKNAKKSPGYNYSDNEDFSSSCVLCCICCCNACQSEDTQCGNCLTCCFESFTKIFCEMCTKMLQWLWLFKFFLFLKKYSQLLLYRLILYFWWNSHIPDWETYAGFLM